MQDLGMALPGRASNGKLAFSELMNAKIRALLQAHASSLTSMATEEYNNNPTGDHTKAHDLLDSMLK